MQDGLWIISKRDYGELCIGIRMGMEQWQKGCAMYNNPGAEDYLRCFKQKK